MIALYIRIVVTGVLLLTLGLAPASASAAEGDGKGFVESPDGMSGWASTEYIMGHPDRFSSKVKLLASRGRADGTANLSASGCSYEVCIDVDGSSTTVTRWASQAFGNVGCTEAFFTYGFRPVICQSYDLSRQAR